MTDQPEDEAGSGLLATTVGVMVFLLLLLFAVQVLFGLYARSAVTAATYEGARIAAGFDAAGDPERGHAEASAHIRRILGSYGRDRLELEWSDDSNSEVLTVRAHNPTFLPGVVRRPLRLDTIERTVRIRIERVAP